MGWLVRRVVGLWGRGDVQNADPGLLSLRSLKSVSLVLTFTEAQSAFLVLPQVPAKVLRLTARVSEARKMFELQFTLGRP